MVTTTRPRSQPTQRRRTGVEHDPAWRNVELPGRGTTYAYDRPHPSPSAPTVVLLHGWTATGSLNWATTMTRLADRFRVVVLDHRGHGQGIRDDDKFTLEDCADDAVALLDVLGVGTAIFVGYSMGGPIAQLIWRRHARASRRARAVRHGRRLHDITRAAAGRGRIGPAAASGTCGAAVGSPAHDPAARDRARERSRETGRAARRRWAATSNAPSTRPGGPSAGSARQVGSARSTCR